MNISISNQYLHIFSHKKDNNDIKDYIQNMIHNCVRYNVMI